MEDINTIGLDVLFHSSIKIEKNGIICYIDPFKINKNYNDADYIFITHSHYDHYSKSDIAKVKKEETIIIGPEDINELGMLKVAPNQEYELEKISFKAVRAYNETKPFHPKANNWVGYILNINGIKYYIAGDTDSVEELKKIECDVAFVPVGGTYTMDYREAVDLVLGINPKIAIPTHYGSIVGEKEDGYKFKRELEARNKNIEVVVML